MAVDRAPGMPLTFEFVPSATVKPLYTVSESDPLSRAISIMELNGFSQLPVTKGRGSKPAGAVTWESIGRALAHNPRATLIDSMNTRFPRASLTDNLLENIGSVYSDGYVVVVDSRGDISGIVTSADLVEQFSNIAGPYLWLERIETELRKILDALVRSSLLDARQIAASLPAESGKSARDIDDHTLGELVSIVTHPSVWVLLDSTHDRKVVGAALNRATELRNRIMHFRATDKSDRAVRENLPALVSVVSALSQHVAGEESAKSK